MMTANATLAKRAWELTFPTHEPPDFAQLPPAADFVASVARNLIGVFNSEEPREWNADDAPKFLRRLAAHDDPWLTGGEEEAERVRRALHLPPCTPLWPLALELADAVTTAITAALQTAQ